MLDYSYTVKKFKTGEIFNQNLSNAENALRLAVIC